MQYRTQMRVRTIWLPLGTLLVGAGLAAGCKSAGSAEQQESRKLSTTIQEYHGLASTAIEDLETTLVAHDELVNAPAGNMVEPYERFAAGVRKCVKNKEQMSKTSTVMAAQAQVRFANWDAQIANFTNANMAERSRTQLDATRARYDAVTEAGRAVMTAYGPLLALLEDHALYMSAALNPSATAVLKEDEDELNEMKADLSESIDNLVAAAEEFVQATSMTVQPVEAAASSDG